MKRRPFAFSLSWRTDASSHDGRRPSVLAGTASRLALAASVALFALGGSARAQTTYYWTGGNGTWSNSALWSTTLSATTAANAVPDLTTTAVLPMTSATGSAITVTLSETGSARGISFLPTFTQSGSIHAASAQSFVLGAGGIFKPAGAFNTAANVSFSLADSQAWRFGGATTIWGPIARTTATSTNQTLLVSGTGAGPTIDLNGVISDGGSGGSLGLEFASSGTFNLRAANMYTGLTTLQDNAFVNLAFNSTSPAAPATNILASTGTLAFAGTGRLTLTGSASRTSSQAFAATTLGAGASAAVALTPGTSGTAELNLGTVTATGGVLRLPTPAANTVVRVSGPDRILPFGLLTSSGSFAAVVGGTIQAATLTNGTFNNATLTDPAGNYNILASGTLTSSATANVLFLSGANGGNRTFNLGNSDFTVNAIRTDVVVQADNGITISATTGRLLIGDSGQLVLGTLPRVDTFGSFNIQATIADSGTTPGRLVLDGGQYYDSRGTTLSGSNTHSGGTVIAGAEGMIALNHPNALGTGTFTIGGLNNELITNANRTLANNPQIWNSNFSYISANSLNMGTGQVSLGETATATGRRTVSVTSTGLFTIAGTIVDGSDPVFPATGLEKAGTGMMALTGSNAYTGQTRVSAGALRFANRLAMYGGGTSAWTADNLTTASGANLVVNVGGAGEFTDADIGMLAGLGTSTSGFLPGSFIGIDTTNVSSGTFLLTSQIANANSVGIAKYGTGTLVLSGSSSFTGGVRATQNRVLVTVPAAMGSGTGVVDGGILDLGGGTFNNVFNVTSGTLTNGTLSLANLGTSGSVTTSAFAAIPANLTGTASFTKLGSGTLSLLGANTFSGSSRNTAGTVFFNAIGNVTGTTPNSFGLPTLASSTIGLGGATTVYVGSGHTTDRVFDMYAAGADTIEASGSGRLTITSDLRISGTGARTITLTGSGQGQLAGIPNAANNTVVSLTKTGTGVWSITGSSGFTGSLAINGGRLNLAHANVTNAATNVALGQYNAPQLWAVGVSGTVGSVVGWSGATLGADNGNLIVAGTTQTGSNGVMIVATTKTGTVTLQNMWFLQGGSYPKNTWRGNANLVIGSLSGTALDAVGQNSVAFTLRQIGATRLTGDNTYVGPMYLSGGTLLLDYTTSAGSKLADAYPLRLNGNMASSGLLEWAGGDIVLRGTPAAAGGEELISGLFAGFGSGYWGGGWNIGRDGGTGVLNTGTGGITVGVNAGLSWLNVRGGGIVKTVNANVNGLLGVRASVTGTNGADFATVDGTGLVQPYTGYTPLDLAANTSAATTTTYQLTGGGRNTAAKAGWSMKIKNSGASDVLDLNGNGLGLNSGGAILYAGGGDGRYSITGTGALFASGANHGFYVAENAELTLANSTISSGGASTWVKSGPGTLVLSLQQDWSGSTLGPATILEGVGRWTNSNWFRTGWAVAASPAGSAAEFAPADGLPGITSPSGITTFLAGSGINNQGAIRSRYGENAILGTIELQEGGARINADAGTLRLGGLFTLAPNGHATPTITFGGAGTILVDGTGNVISGATIVNKDGSGTLVVTATNTSTGTTAVTGGELVWGRRAAFYNADTTRWNVFNFTTGSGAAMSFRVGDAAGAFTDADIATLATVGTNMGGFMAGSYIGLDTSGASSGSYVYSGSIADTAGGMLGVAKSGSGTLTLTGSANTFSGGVLVRGGRLLLTGTNQIGSGVAVADGGLLDVNNQPIANAFSIRSGTIANATFDVSRLTANVTGPGLVSATLTGTGGLVKTGSGTLALSAANAYTGATTVSQGLLSIASDANLNGTSSALIFAGGGLQVTGTDLTALNPGRTTTFTSGSTVLFDVAVPTHSFAVSQVLDQGTGGLTKSGLGTLAVGAASTYSGATTISGGVLRLDDAGSLPGGIGATGGSSPLVLAGGVVGLATGDFSRPIGSGADAVSFGTGGGGFAAYGADRTVNFGGAAATITWNSVSTGFGSKTLMLGAPTATHKVTVVNPLALGLDNRTVQVDDGAATFDGELSGVISGTGGMVKTGAGTLLLSATNTYLGTTTVSAGTLRPGNALAIGGTANAITVNGGVLDLSDYSLTRSAVVSLSSGTIASGTLAFTGTNANFTNGFVSSVVTGTMGFTVIGGNVLGFSGLNTYTGKVAAQNGVLAAAILSGSGQASSLGSGTGANATIDLGNLATGGTFRYIGVASATTNRTFNLSGTSGGGAIENNGGDALVISSTVTATGAGTKTLTLGGTSTAANTIGVILENSGANKTNVVKDGPGLWRINRTSSYTGSFTVRNGTLVAAADSTSTNGAFGASSVTDVFVGDSSPTATGTAALLLAAGFNTTKVMNVQGGGGSQVVVLGGEGGAVDFQSSTYLGRGVTLVAGAGGTTSFSGFWYGPTGVGSSPVGSVSIGSAGNTGMVRVFRNLAPSGSVGVRFGTLSLGESGTIAGSGPLTIDSGATLAGIGFVTGTLGGAGLVGPGNSPGILTAQAVDPTAGLDWAFELTGTVPTYSDAFASVNDVLRLTGTTSPFTTNLTGSNAIGVYFDVGSLTQGDTFRGGFFTDLASDFQSSVIDANYTYWVTGSGVGQTTYESKTYVPLASVYPSLDVAVTTVSSTAEFAVGSLTSGQVMQFTVVVPEPGAIALAALGLGLAGYAIRRRRAV